MAKINHNLNCCANCTRCIVTIELRNKVFYCIFGQSRKPIKNIEEDYCEQIDKIIK